jgi:corrinoid protein of di/trimethylamine methyltransferase
MKQDLLKAMAQSIIDGDGVTAAELAHQAIAQDIDPLDAINNGFVAGINQVGERYSCGEAFVPDLVLAGSAMSAAMEVLEPVLAQSDTQWESLGVVVLATVEGDIHDIGKNIVGTMLSASGFTVHDLGVNVPVKQIVEKASEVEADIVALSALLTTTMTRQEDVPKALEEAGLRDSVKVIVGGAPVTQDWADAIGADGFGKDAVSAVTVAKELVSKP